MPIHPALAERFALLEGITSFPAAFADPTLRARLDEFVTWPASPPPAVRTEDTTAPGPHGPVPLRVYRPEADGAGRPGLVWMHGGAFRMGSMDAPDSDHTAREVCRRAGAVVVGVDYRLAVGDVHHPVPLDDVVAAARWACAHAADLGLDPARLCFGGASAGGTLATGAALRVRDEDGWLPAALVLAYATLHSVVPTPTGRLAALLDDVPRPLRFRPEDTYEITENYLGGAVTGADGYAFPALGDLEGLCPVVLLNAEYDDLRASAQEFAAQLARAGVDVTQTLVRGMLHGFLDLPRDLPPVEEALAVIAHRVEGAT